MNKILFCSSFVKYMAPKKQVLSEFFLTRIDKLKFT